MSTKLPEDLMNSSWKEALKLRGQLRAIVGKDQTCTSVELFEAVVKHIDRLEHQNFRMRKIVKQEQLECFKRSTIAVNGSSQKTSYEGGESTCRIILAKFNSLNHKWTQPAYIKPDPGPCPKCAGSGKIVWTTHCTECEGTGNETHNQ